MKMRISYLLLGIFSFFISNSQAGIYIGTDAEVPIVNQYPHPIMPPVPVDYIPNTSPPPQETTIVQASVEELPGVDVTTPSVTVLTQPNAHLPITFPLMTEQNVQLPKTYSLMTEQSVHPARTYAVEPLQTERIEPEKEKVPVTKVEVNTIEPEKIIETTKEELPIREAWVEKTVVASKPLVPMPVLPVVEPVIEPVATPNAVIYPSISMSKRLEIPSRASMSTRPGVIDPWVGSLAVMKNPPLFFPEEPLRHLVAPSVPLDEEPNVPNFDLLDDPALLAGPVVLPAPVLEQRYKVYSGSLKDNVTRMIHESGWGRVVWNVPNDYQWEGDITIKAGNIKDAVLQLLEPYPVQAIFYNTNHIVAIVPRRAV